MVSTIYDDVFRTLLNDCSELIIPVINEVFGEKYTGREKIVFTPNEHFMNRYSGNENKIITDTSFSIVGKITKKYHLECQSSADNSMLVRIFEYGTQIALDEGVILKNTLTVKFPHSAILFLRHTKNTPDKMTVRIITSGGETSYDVPIVKVQNYDVRKIFDKNLLLFLPFHIFSHEKKFVDYENIPEEFQKLLKEYITIRENLENLQKEGNIGEYTKQIICEMSKRVAEGLASHYEKIQKGVGSVMVGQVLDYEIKRIYNDARAEGRAEGLAEGLAEGKFYAITDNLEALMQSFKISLNDAMDALKIPEDMREKIKKHLKD